MGINKTGARTASLKWRTAIAMVGAMVLMIIIACMFCLY
jgi:hypothetical protein